MKKGLIAMAVVMVLLAIFFVAGGDRGTKNLIGNFLGYGDCPNCSDSWWWKDYGSIEYGDVKALEEGKDYTKTKSGVFRDIQVEVIVESYGVMMCKECLAHPERLDEEKIAQNLRNYDWPKEKVEAAKEAVIHYKNKR